MSPQIKSVAEQEKSPEKPSGLFLSAETRPNCWIELSRANFNQNIASLKKLIGPQRSIAAVLKSNAYSHGLVSVANLCQENSQVAYIAVFLLSDALLLREQGITKPILVLGGYDCPISRGIAHAIDLVVYDWQTAQEISAKAAELKITTNIHLKIDSGLVRLGFLPEEILEVVEYLKKNQYIKFTGIYSHFAESDSQDLTFTSSQLLRFQETVEILKARGITMPYVHVANTAATLRFTHAQPVTINGASAHEIIVQNAMSCATMIRCGGAIYGTYKNKLFYEQAQAQIPGFKLQQFLTVKSRIMCIRNVPAGTPIGYACSFTTNRTTTVGIVSLGYFDGYDRRLSNNSVMFVGDKLVPVIGRIGMNMTALDLTDVPNAKLYDEVTVLGDHDGIRVQDLAKRIDSIDYDVFNKLNAGLTRIIV